MSDSRDLDGLSFVVDPVNNPIASDPDSPFLFASL
jgi:hypothetical protein